MRRSGFRHRLAYRKALAGKRIMILGNGPSLNADYEKFHDVVNEGDCMCVNRFAHAPLFTRIRPRYYILCDPAFCLPEEQVGSGHLLDMRHQLFAEIITKLSWEMTLLLPSYARHNKPGSLPVHPLLHIRYFNNVKLNHRLPDWIKFPLLSANMACPSLRNVLIGALYCSINLGYERIILMGADHSWFEQIGVDQSNRVYVNDPHFNDPENAGNPEKVFLFRDTEKKIPYRIADFFMDQVVVFRTYLELRAYAEKMGTSVQNAGTKSYIDAFERIEFIPPA